LDFQSISITF